jgi:hypothetical protein
MRHHLECLWQALGLPMPRRQRRLHVRDVALRLLAVAVPAHAHAVPQRAEQERQQQHRSARAERQRRRAHTGRCGRRLHVHPTEARETDDRVRVRVRDGGERGTAPEQRDPGKPAEHRAARLWVARHLA